jgi:hypothetical protein
MSAAAVPWPCTVAEVDDMPGRWVCVPDGAEELAGAGCDEDEATDDMCDRIEAATVH